MEAPHKFVNGYLITYPESAVSDCQLGRNVLDIVARILQPVRNGQQTPAQPQFSVNCGNCRSSSPSHFLISLPRTANYRERCPLIRMGEIEVFRIG